MLLTGSKYKKALYYEYTDSSFTEKIKKAEHLGFLGPVIKGEVGETVEVSNGYPILTALVNNFFLNQTNVVLLGDLYEQGQPTLQHVPMGCC